MFKPSGTLLVGLLWVPNERVSELLAHRGNLADQGLEVIFNERAQDKELTAPTFFHETEFGSVSQLIVDTYGVPAYKEANPALFTTVTFPFLFAIMFGDIFHGAMLLCGGLLVYAIGNDLGALYKSRHFLLLMGIFSLFTGLCYNDYTSVALYLFPTCYDFPEGAKEGIPKEGCVYPLGVDPSWYLGSLELTYMNSLKMKIAVIYGVAQMTFGIFLRGGNSLYFRSYLDFFFEFVPQLLIMLCLFGYMDVLIVVKWLTDYSANTNVAPALINVMIDMALSGGVPSVPGEASLIGDQAT